MFDTYKIFLNDIKYFWMIKKSKMFEFKIGLRRQHETSVLFTIFNENLCKRTFNTIYFIKKNHFAKVSQTNDKNMRKNAKCDANVKANWTRAVNRQPGFRRKDL